MDIDREYRDTRAAMLRAQIKAAAPAMRRDFWASKAQNSDDSDRRYGPENGR